MGELKVIEVESPASVADVVLALADEPGLVCLSGAGWGQSMITSRPVEVSTDLAVLDRDAPGVGWFGWLGYDRPHRLARHDHLLRRVGDRWQIELAWTESRAAELEQAQLRYRQALERPGAAEEWQVGPFLGGPRDEHLRAVETAIGLIRDGELYQVNVCTRLTASFQGRPAALFAAALPALAPRYGAYVQDGDRALVSLSPELFVHRAGREVRSAPIKGTRPRGASGDAGRQLRASAKDVAENVMIVDLVRNDLGRVSVPGSVRARDLLELQAHPGVWHLVSTVGATLRADAGDAGLLEAIFPPGSVTGAPKVRAVRAIAELEEQPRGVYTGAVGFSSREETVFNVAIRTFEIGDGRIELGVGGGITVDSVPMLEWQETRHKALPLIAAIGGRPPAGDPVEPVPASRLAGGLLETMLAVDGRVLRLADHLARIDLSCRELYGAPLPASAEARVREALPAAGRWAVRLTVLPDLEISVEASAAVARTGRLELRTAHRPGWWRHKWADRSWITDAQALFLAQDGTVLETTFGNVFLIDAAGGLITPPLRDDLLPGVTRRALLDLARDQGRAVQLRGFTLDELLGAAAVVSSSSLSGLRAIETVNGAALGRRDADVRELATQLGFGSATANS